MPLWYCSFRQRRLRRQCAIGQRLNIDHLPIRAFLVEQFLVGADLHDAAAVQDHDPVGVGARAWAMSHY
jgi:hypothetical protein